MTPSAECVAIRGVLSNSSQRRKSSSIQVASSDRNRSIPVCRMMRIMFSTLTNGTRLKGPGTGRHISPPCDRREPIDAEMPILRARSKARARKIGPVRRIGPDLRLQTKCVGLPIEPSALARRRAVEIVPGIELHAGLVGQQFKDAPGRRRLEPRRKLAARRRCRGRSCGRSPCRA